MPAIQWARDLMTALKNTGTGEDKLEIIRAAMLERYNDRLNARLAKDHPDRHLTALEAVAALEAAHAEDPHRVPDLTLEKARQLTNTGTYTELPPPKHAAELLPPPPEGPAPDRVILPPEGPMAAPPKVLAGVTSLSGDVNTVGPKPIVKGDDGRTARQGSMKAPGKTAGMPAADAVGAGHGSG